MRFTAIKRRRGLREDAGITLIEVSIAMGIFAIAMAGVAQMLVTVANPMNLQKQRQAASQHCRTLISQIRQERDTSVAAFPGAITVRWPNNFVTTDATIITLPNETITVTYANPAANPLRMTVRSRWSDKSGRFITTSVSTLLTGNT